MTFISSFLWYVQPTVIKRYVKSYGVMEHNFTESGGVKILEINNILREKEKKQFSVCLEDQIWVIYIQLADTCTYLVCLLAARALFFHVNPNLKKVNFPFSVSIRIFIFYALDIPGKKITNEGERKKELQLHWVSVVLWTLLHPQLQLRACCYGNVHNLLPQATPRFSRPNSILILLISLCFCELDTYLFHPTRNRFLRSFLDLANSKFIANPQ